MYEQDWVLDNQIKPLNQSGRIGRLFEGPRTSYVSCSRSGKWLVPIRFMIFGLQFLMVTPLKVLMVLWKDLYIYGNSECIN